MRRGSFGSGRFSLLKNRLKPEPWIPPELIGMQLAGGGRRRGQPERKQIEAMFQQGSLVYWQGPQTRVLTERFREICPLRHVQTCTSGTVAIHIAVAAAGIGPGDEVITSADHSPPWQGRSPASSANDAGGPSRTARE